MWKAQHEHSSNYIIVCST